MYDYKGKAFVLLACDSAFISRYVNEVLCVKDEGREHLHNFMHAILQSDQSFEILDALCDRIISNKAIFSFRRNKLILSMISPLQGDDFIQKKRSAWLTHYISANHMEKMKMEAFFAAQSVLPEPEKKKNMLQFLYLNPDYEAFRNLPLTPSMFSWSGSAVPIYRQRIDYFEDLLSCMKGGQFIQHRDRIMREIIYCRAAITREQRCEVLENR